MVRETNNVCFGQIAQETQVVVREDNKRDHLKRSPENVSPPNFSEQNNSGYYKRGSRLVAETDSFIRRSSNSSAINCYQNSNNSSNKNNNSSSSSNNNNPDNRSRTRDRLYRNGPNSAAVLLGSSPSVLSERTSSGASHKNNNSRVPPTSWYEAAATYTNGPGGSGNADVSAANINSNHYQTAASTELQAATATTNSTTTSSYIAYSYASSPAHNHTAPSSTTLSSVRNTTLYGNVSQTDKDAETPPLLNKNKQKLLKSSSSLRSGSGSPTTTATETGTTLLSEVIGLAGLTTMNSSATVSAPSTSSSSSSNYNNNNSRSNQTANNSCNTVSSTININTNNNISVSGNNRNITNTETTHSGGGGSNSVGGILNAAALAAAGSKGGSSEDGRKNASSSSSGNSCGNSSSNVHTSSNNPSTSASHHTSRSAGHTHFHGRSTTSSSRSHSRSPSSYSSSHSSSSSSSSSASSHSHASSPVGGRDVEPSNIANSSSSRSGSRNLQSAVAVPPTSSGLNHPSGSNVCGSSSSSTSSTSSGTPTGNPVVHSEDNRPLAIRVRNLPARSSDTSLKDGLFHEYKKHGKVTWVKVVGQNAERYALVCFKKPEDVEKALEVSHDKLFFGCKIDVEPYQGYDVEDNEFRPYEAELDEYHPKSTRTLFIGNLEKEITSSELRQHFECFGEIIEIDIKKQGMSAYAFCQYSDIVSVVKAMRKMDGEHLGNNRIKLGFGKSMPTNCVWIDGVGEKISESHLQSQFSRYGGVSKVVVDRQKQLALVLYEQIQYAQTAVKEMRGATLRGRKLQVDFASRECQDAFYEKLEKQSAGSRFSRYESQSRSRASSFSRHQNSNDGCSPGNTPGSSSSSSAGPPPSVPVLSSAIVAGTSSLCASGNTLASVVVGQTSGNTTPARSRGSRSSRHTMEYEYLDTRRFRSCDEYSQGSATSHDEDSSVVNHSSSNTNAYSGVGLRSDSPLLSRLGPIVNNSSKDSSSDMLEMAVRSRRCDKSPAKQKGDIRLFQKERAVLLEQLEECPSSGDESIVTPRKRIKIDHHSNNSFSGLSQSHSLDEQQQPPHKNLNCDYLLNDPMHRKSEIRRLSECSSSLNKYSTSQQNYHHSHHAVPPPPPHHHHQQQQLSRRPSIDYTATSGGGGSVGVANISSVRHNSTSSSNSDHHPPPHSSSSSMACKRRRVVGSSGNGNIAVSSNTLLSSSAGGGGSVSSFANDDCHHHVSRGRGHQLHSHHSHEASGGESADGSRPGTPLCDERPEVLPSEPRRVPRERPREPMVLPLPKFGIQFFHQCRNSLNAVNTSYHHQHYGSSSFTSSPAVGSNNPGSSHLFSNNMLNRGENGSFSGNNHSSLSHSSSTTAPASTIAAGVTSGSCYLPSPSTRYTPHWRPHHQHHHHQQPVGGHHGHSGGVTPSSSSSMVSPMRSRSLSSNSSDSDVPGQSSSGSPSLEERIRTLDEMYERWSGGGSSGGLAVGSNVVKRHDFSNTPPTWQHIRSNSQTADHHHSNNSDVRSNTPSTPASRHKFLDIDVNEMQPSDIVKSVLAKKSIFDDDLQRLKKNQWYEPTSDSSQLSKSIINVCTSPALPNLQATKTPVFGCTTNVSNSSSSAGAQNKTSGALLQRLNSISPMNSPQASMSPYNSPSPSPSVTSNVSLILGGSSLSKPTEISTCGGLIALQQNPVGAVATSSSPASSSGTKCLQYPFPAHPPLPNTAAPLQSAQPIPPPPAETSKPSVIQPPLPPMEVLQPPQPPATLPNSSSPTTAGISSKPKTLVLSKSLSVPPLPPATATTESRILTKSVSVPGSTNLGTVKTSTTTSVEGLTSAPHLEQNQPQQSASGSSSLNPPKSHNKEYNSIAKTSSHSLSPSTSESVVKQRNDKSHKYNHRNIDEKKSSKSDKRKNSNSSQLFQSQASAAESSDVDEHDSKKERKERNEKREKELKKQQEREERERKEREERDRQEKERLEKERLEKDRLERERFEKERLEKERLEKERLEKERLERERLEREERESLQREKDRIRKEDEQRAKEERERKEREEKERKSNEQREREENEIKKLEEIELREHEEYEQKEKEKLEREKIREKDRKRQEGCVSDKRDINLLKEHQRRKENSTSQSQAKLVIDMTSATSQTAHDFFRRGEAEHQNDKENSTDETISSMDTNVVSNKHKNRKTSRNTSPVRHPKRRLSPQDTNANNSATSGALAHTDDHSKRMRIDLQSSTNQTQTQLNDLSSVNISICGDTRDSKDHHAKDRNKHNRISSAGHKSHFANSAEKEHSTTKHHRTKHHHHHNKVQSNQATTTESTNLLKNDTDHVVSNCVGKTEEDITGLDVEVKPKISSLLSSDDEEILENPITVTQNPNKSSNSSSHKHREHTSSSQHSRHKSNKREREHHREKKRHSNSTLSSGHTSAIIANESLPSTPPSANCNATDEELTPSSGNQLMHNRISGNTEGTNYDVKLKLESSERKLSRCSDDGNSHQHQTPSQRHNNLSKSTPQSSARRVLLSSAEDTDGGGGGVEMGPDDDDSDNRTHSIFDIPDDGPYVSMYDKVKARSCKNMQKQEEEKKIKAKFSQLKQSRAKREEKKRSTSYDGDSDSDFDRASSEHQKQHSRSGSYKMLSGGGGLSSTGDEQEMEPIECKTPTRNRRRSSQASSSATSIHPHRLCSDSDDNNSVTRRRLKIQDNVRRLCDDGDETSEDDLIRRHNTGLTNKRLLHHTSRIASDSESQSQSAADIKLKQEPLDAFSDGINTSIMKHLKQKIKKEVEAMEASGETSEFGDFKFKTQSSLCSSADEQATAQNIKFETAAGELLSAKEIKKEIKDYYAEEYLQAEEKFHKSPNVLTATQHCSSEQTKIKKHKKSKKRQKTPTQDSIALAKDQIVAEVLAKHSSQSGGDAKLLNVDNDSKNSLHLTIPCYDAFDALKRDDTLIAKVSPDLHITGEKKRHKDRKEKKRDKLRHMSADVPVSGLELDKHLYEKEKHRLKKSKKSKSLDIARQSSTLTASSVVGQQNISAVLVSCTSQQKRSGGEKMEDIFGPISDEDEDDMTDSDIGSRDLNCISNRNTSSSNMPGPIVSAALNPYKQEPLTPKSHTVEENEENKQKLSCAALIGSTTHLDRMAERQHRKEKREKKRKEREKSRSSDHNQSSMGGFLSSTIVSSNKSLEDENSVDLDAAGRALEAQLMDDSDNKILEDATPSTANTYRSDMTDVFLFSDCDENSLEMSSTNKHEKKDSEKEHTMTSISCKNKEKKKKKKRSKEEKLLHHQRRESSSSNTSQLATNMMASSSSTTSKLTIDIHAASKHSQKSSEENISSLSPLCKPSPSLPCLLDDDDNEDLSSIHSSKLTPTTSLNNAVTAVSCNTPHRSSKDILTLSPHMKDKQMISPIPKTPTINTNNNSSLNDSPEILNKVTTTPKTPTSSTRAGGKVINTTPTSSSGPTVSVMNLSNDSSAISNTMASPSSASLLTSTQQKKKPEIFIPGFDREIDERISESAVQSISAEFNTPIDSMADEPKIPVESPPDASKLEKQEESKSRVTISQEETESAVSALLGESFGNSSADYSFNDDDDGLEDLNNVISDPDPALQPGEPDEEAALAAKAIECEVASSTITDTVEEDTEEVCKAVQSLRQDELEIKADTPQSVRDLQIDTDTEENADEADSSGSHSLKIDETVQSNNSSLNLEKANTANSSTEENKTEYGKNQQLLKSSVITKIETSSTTTTTSTTKQLSNQTTSSEPKIEPPTINKQDQPAVQPVQNVMPPVTLEVALSATQTCIKTTAPSMPTTTINTTTIAGVTMAYTSTPIKTSITFASTSVSSSTPKQMQVTIGKSITTVASTTSYVMQPPTITIPEPNTQFVVPQLGLSPRSVVSSAAHHNESSTSTNSNSIHSPSGAHMPPQSPVGSTYLMSVRSQSPHSPKQNGSRGNTPTQRQQSPHTPTSTTSNLSISTSITPLQQQNILIQRAVQHQQHMMSPPLSSQGHASQNNSPLSSPTSMQQRQISQGGAVHKITSQQQQHSPSGPEQQPQQHMIKINNYSTPPTSSLQTATINSMLISTSQQQQQHQYQHHSQQSSPQKNHGKASIEQQQQQQPQQPNVTPIGQHILPISVQKMPPVPTHPTIISKVVTVTPQHAQQSLMQTPASPNSSNMYSPTTSVSNINRSSRQSPQIIQQLTMKTIQQQHQQHHQQQQPSQMQLMHQHQQQQQQQRQQQQHLMQIQQQQLFNQQQQQQQKLPSQPQQSSVMSQQQTLQQLQQQQQHQQQNQNQHGFVASQQRNLQSPQQHMQHQQQQSEIAQQHKVQYQQQQKQHQMLTTQQSPSAQQNHPQQQQNITQTSQMPQRFLVQQHIVGMPQQQKQQQEQQLHPMPNISHQTSSPQAHQSTGVNQQKSSPIFVKQQQHQHVNLRQREQSPSPQRMVQHQQQQTVSEISRVIMSTNQPIQQHIEPSPSTQTTNDNSEQQSSSCTTSSLAGNNKHSAEVVSVIRTPTPTTTATTPVQVTVPALTTAQTPLQNLNVSLLESTTTTTSSSNENTNTLPIKEDNTNKILPSKKDEIEQDSKADNDIWSAKEANNSTNGSNKANVGNTVIKKNESVNVSVTTTASISTTSIKATVSCAAKDQTSDESQSKNQVEITESKTTVDAQNEESVLPNDSQNTTNINASATTNYSQTGNVTTDHETEDETETQQMPSFEQVSIQGGRPSTRGTGAKRGRQPRGGKKSSAAAEASLINNSAVNANDGDSSQNQTDLGGISGGVQTRLRKPTTASPASRGRKGRPPRNSSLQQQQEQQPPAAQINTATVTGSGTAPTVTNPILTSAEKKGRSQAAAAATALPSLSETTHQHNQDVYEFHDESGDEAKTATLSSAVSTTNSAGSTDHRPRLILTIKSPAQGAAPLVKASEKSINVESQPTSDVPASAISQTQQIISNPNQLEQTATDLAAAANTRKSRRLLEKDRSTIDDIIEDVVRNTNTNIAAPTGGNLPAGTTSIAANILTNTLPKGAQTPPRRSGRNSSQSKPLKASDSVQTTAPNPVGRPRKSKDRKNINDLDLEQTPSPQPKHVVHDISDDMDDAKSVSTPPPTSAPLEISSAQLQQQPQEPMHVTTPNTTPPPKIQLQQPQATTQQQSVTVPTLSSATTASTTTTTTTTTTTNTMPQHPKKKALAAAEIESYQQHSSSCTTATLVTSSTTNMHSALPSGGIPMLNTAAPASQKTTGGAADTVNKPLIDPVTGIVSGLQMQQAKEGNLPSATAAQSQPLRGPTDSKKMIQAAVGAENSPVHNKLQNLPATLPGSVATPITALTKPVQVEATAAQVAASTVATAMLNKSVSVLVKTSNIPPTTSDVVQQQQTVVQRQDTAMPTKQPIILQQQTTTVMHAQHTNVRPPTSLKAHVLNSQKLQQQQQQQLQQSGQQQYINQQQQQKQQILHQKQSPTSQAVTHVIQNSIVQRQTLTSAAASTSTQNQATKQQLLINIPPPTLHSPRPAATNVLNSPRHLPQHTQQQQQQPLVIKQAHETHGTQQVLHVLTSKNLASKTTAVQNIPTTPQPTAVHHITSQQQQPLNASPHPSYSTYIQTSTSGSHSKQQLPQQPVVIHQQTIGGPSKATTTPMVIPPGLLGLPAHPAMVIQTKTSAPAHSPSGTSSTATVHLQQHTPSPPLLQQTHLIKPTNKPMIHGIQTQGVPHVLNTVASPSPPAVTVKPTTQQQSSITPNVGASNLRTAIPTISPQSQARIGSIILPSGMQMPAHFDANMNEASFPGAIGRVGVPTREQFMIYQQILRQHDPLNPAALRDYDDNMLGSSPPLELRRPGSVPRTIAVPHSLQSPQDRATDSPQVAQVYVHNTRISAHTHYDVTGRPTVAGQSTSYYDASRQIPLEPPPAHRSAAVHSVVAPPAQTVVVPHPSVGSSSPFMAAAPPATAGQMAPSPGPPNTAALHTKVLEREREQRERELEQQLLREKEQIMARGGAGGADAHNMQVATPPPPTNLQANTATHQLPPHAKQPPPLPLPQADSLLTLLQRYPVMWQGLLALKTDQAAVQMHFVFGNPLVARASLPCNSDGSTPPLRIAQRMRLEQTQLEGVAKKMQFENEHCMLLALPCGRDHADVLQQSRNLQSGFITYLQQKMAAGIVNIPLPGSEQAAYVVHIFPSCDFANENLEKAAPDLKNRVADIAHLLIVIATV